MLWEQRSHADIILQLWLKGKIVIVKKKNVKRNWAPLSYTTNSSGILYNQLCKIVSHTFEGGGTLRTVWTGGLVSVEHFFMWWSDKVLSRTEPKTVLPQFDFVRNITSCYNIQVLRPAFEPHRISETIWRVPWCY